MRIQTIVICLSFGVVKSRPSDDSTIDRVFDITEGDKVNIDLAERVGVSHLAVTYPQGINCTLKKTVVTEPYKVCRNVTVPVCRTVQKVRMKNITEDCREQKEYCHYNFRTQQLTKQTIICQRSDEQICDESCPASECPAQCERNPIVVCSTVPQTVAITDKKQRCGKSKTLQTTKICFTYPDSSWVCKEPRSSLDCESEGIRLVSHEVTMPRIECSEKEVKPICVQQHCWLKSNVTDCLTTDIPTEVRLEDQICEQCKQGRTKLRPVIVQGETCDGSAVQEFCAEGEEDSNKWTKTCTVPKNMRDSLLQKILQNTQDQFNEIPDSDISATQHGITFVKEPGDIELGPHSYNSDSHSSSTKGANLFFANRVIQSNKEKQYQKKSQIFEKEKQPISDSKVMKVNFQFTNDDQPSSFNNKLQAAKIKNLKENQIKPRNKSKLAARPTGIPYVYSDLQPTTNKQTKVANHQEKLFPGTTRRQSTKPKFKSFLTKPPTKQTITTSRPLTSPTTVNISTTPPQKQPLTSIGPMVASTSVKMSTKPLLKQQSVHDKVNLQKINKLREHELIPDERQTESFLMIQLNEREQLNTLQPRFKKRPYPGQLTTPKPTQTPHHKYKTTKPQIFKSSTTVYENNNEDISDIIGLLSAPEPSFYTVSSNNNSQHVNNLDEVEKNPLFQRKKIKIIIDGFEVDRIGESEYQTSQRTSTNFEHPKASMNENQKENRFPFLSWQNTEPKDDELTTDNTHKTDHHKHTPRKLIQDETSLERSIETTSKSITMKESSYIISGAQLFNTSMESSTIKIEENLSIIGSHSTSKKESPSINDFHSTGPKEISTTTEGFHENQTPRKNKVKIYELEEGLGDLVKISPEDHIYHIEETTGKPIPNKQTHQNTNNIIIQGRQEQELEVSTQNHDVSNGKPCDIVSTQAIEIESSESAKELNESTTELSESTTELSVNEDIPCEQMKSDKERVTCKLKACFLSIDNCFF